MIEIVDINYRQSIKYLYILKMLIKEENWFKDNIFIFLFLVVHFQGFFYSKFKSLDNSH